MTYLHKIKILFMASLISTAILSSPENHAATVLIWPLDPVLEQDQKAVALWVENQDIVPTQMQIRVLKWEQKEGKDKLNKQNDIIISPPYANIEPGKRQMVRLIKNITMPVGSENAYRILVDEMPSKSAPKHTTSGLILQMRYSVPLFVSGEGIWTKQDYQRPRDLEKSTLPKLSYRMVNLQGKKSLVIKNSGAVHAKIINVSSVQGSTKKEWMTGLVGYILSGSTMNIPIPESINTGKYDSIQVMVNSYPHPITLEKY